MGRNYLKSGFSHDALTSFNEAMDIRKDIYGDSHPEIAETMYNQAKALLKMSKARESDDTKVEARQKLEQALNMFLFTAPF